MDKVFINELYQHQAGIEPVPSNQRIAHWASQVLCVLYPEKAECLFASAEAMLAKWEELKDELESLLKSTAACRFQDPGEKAAAFFSELPSLRSKLQKDVTAILDGDPAAHSAFEVIRAYPGFTAIGFYRIAHALHLLGVPLIPRILTEEAHSKTGIDIHPNAVIGEYFCIDHGTGIVIGETAEIGHHVKIYQSVTLGALSVDKSMANTKRHPTIGHHVVLYAGATILGGDTVVGDYSIIGGNVWLTRSVPPYSKVYHRPEISVETNDVQQHQ